MRWQGQRQSENVEDRRGFGPARIGGVGGLGLGGIVLVLAVSYFTGMNPLTLIDLMSGIQSTTTERPIESVPTGPVKDEIGQFASVVLADTEDTWQQLFPKTGGHYENPRLVLFTGAVHSACGATSSAVGPFYCPQDRKLYLDVSFFKDMSQRLGAPGRFCPGVCDRPRGRPPRPEFARNCRESPPASKSGRESRGERLVCSPGITGRLLCGCLGPPCQP